MWEESSTNLRRGAGGGSGARVGGARPRRPRTSRDGDVEAARRSRPPLRLGLQRPEPDPHPRAERPAVRVPLGDRTRMWTKARCLAALNARLPSVHGRGGVPAADPAAGDGLVWEARHRATGSRSASATRARARPTSTERLRFARSVLGSATRRTSARSRSSTAAAVRSSSSLNSASAARQRGSFRARRCSTSAPPARSARSAPPAGRAQRAWRSHEPGGGEAVEHLGGARRADRRRRRARRGQLAVLAQPRTAALYWASLSSPGRWVSRPAQPPHAAIVALNAIRRPRRAPACGSAPWLVSGHRLGIASGATAPAPPAARRALGAQQDRRTARSQAR